MEIIHTNIADFPKKHYKGPKNYEYHRQKIVPREKTNQSTVSVYELPPWKSAYPYHYHLQTEEIFFIVEGNWIVKTPSGEKTIKKGDFLFFPAGEEWAHKITNTSETEQLIYINFDTTNTVEATIYPDSNKVEIAHKNFIKHFNLDDEKDYYDRE